MTCKWPVDNANGWEYNLCVCACVSIYTWHVQINMCDLYNESNSFPLVLCVARPFDVTWLMYINVKCVIIFPRFAGEYCLNNDNRTPSFPVFLSMPLALFLLESCFLSYRHKIFSYFIINVIFRKVRYVNDITSVTGNIFILLTRFFLLPII